MNVLSTVLGKLRVATAKTSVFAMKHKIVSGIILLAVAGGGYYSYTVWKADHTPAQYVLASASIAAIQTTVTGSGQVAASHQLDLTPKASGTVAKVYVHAGDRVTAGQIVAALDSTDAQKSVRDAKTSLDSARISYAQSTATSQDTTQKSRDAAYDTVVTTETNSGSTLTYLDTILKNSEVVFDDVNLVRGVEPSIDSVANQARASYAAAVLAHNTLQATYIQTRRSASPQDVLTLITNEYQSTVAIAQASRDLLAFFQLMDRTITVHNGIIRPTTLAGQIANMTTYSDTSANDATKVLSAKITLSSSISAGTTSGTPLDVQSAQLSLERAQNAYQDALDTLANYTVHAPFSGSIAKVNVQQYDQGGGSASVATLITDQQYAELSLNETDAAKVQAGQKATLTFDAIDGLTMTGTVAEVDQVGTVSQNVVSYAVKIGFDQNDIRIRPGMTVNATIITASKDAALLLPSAAVKSQGTQYYVEVATGATIPMRQGLASSTGSIHTASSTRPSGFGGRTLTVDVTGVTLTRVPVTLGLQSDTMTEILTGLTPGQRVVTQTIAKSGKTTSTSAPSLLGNIGGTRRASGTGGTTGARIGG
jgi:HlyD family secretion protein